MQVARGGEQAETPRGERGEPFVEELSGVIGEAVLAQLHEHLADPRDRITALPQ